MRHYYWVNSRANIYMLLVVTHFRVVMFDDIAQLFFVTNEIKDEFSLVLFSL